MPLSQEQDRRGEAQQDREFPSRKGDQSSSGGNHRVRHSLQGTAGAGEPCLTWGNCNSQRLPAQQGPGAPARPPTSAPQLNLPELLDIPASSMYMSQMLSGMANGSSCSYLGNQIPSSNHSQGLLRTSSFASEDFLCLASFY